jgi:putative ABC transport system permease protein
MLNDVRLGLRLLFRQPGFAVAAAGTLALGVGVNAAVFAVAWQMLLKPLPAPDAGRLVHVWETYDGRSINPVAPAFYHEWLRDARAFDALAASTYFDDRVSLVGAGEPEQITMRSVTGSYFRLVGIAPIAGRAIDDRDLAGDATAIVLAERLWRRRFGADPAVVGRTIQIRGAACVVVGVMPASVDDIDGPIDAWGGLTFSPEQAATGLAHYLKVIGRLRPEVSVRQAHEEAAAIVERTRARFPRLNQKLSGLVRPIAAERGEDLRPALATLAGAAAFVLLMACANLASLQLARGAARAREFTIRAALGASRTRLVRQVLVEVSVLGAVGAAASLAVSRLILNALTAAAPASLRAATEARTDPMVLAYAIALATLGALLFALGPAWRSASTATRWLRQHGSTGDRRATAARGVLVVVQVAIAAVLLAGAALLVTSLARVLRVHPGFDAQGVIAFDVNAPSAPDAGERLAFFERVLDEMRTLPGVTSACAINQIPFDTEGNMTYVPDGETRLVPALPRTVTPECFDVLRIPVVGGRLFAAREPTRVAVVTQRFAAAAFPGADPIGRKLHVGLPDGPPIEIVGVVADSRQQSLESQPYPQVYELAGYAPFPIARVMIRAGGDPRSLFAAVRGAVRRVDPDQPVARLRSLDTVVAGTTAARRFNLLLIGGFAALALALAAIGLYGLLAEIVTQRQREIGIRLALGATGRSVVRLMMTRAFAAVAIGLAIGLPTATLASRLIRQQLYGVAPTDPRVYAGVGAVLVVVGLMAGWLPARRAGRVDPAAMLRN